MGARAFGSVAFTLSTNGRIDPSEEMEERPICYSQIPDSANKAKDDNELADRVCKGTCAHLKNSCGKLLGCGDQSFDVSKHCPVTCAQGTPTESPNVGNAINAAINAALEEAEVEAAGAGAEAAGGNAANAAGAAAKGAPAPGAAANAAGAAAKGAPAPGAAANVAGAAAKQAANLVGGFLKGFGK